MSDNFLSRWSKRKLEAKEKPVNNELPPSDLKTESSSNLPAQSLQANQPKDIAVSTGSPTDSAGHNAPSEPPVPTEADLQGIELGGDVKAFLSDKVSADLKNKAFKALFSRPEYNVMDGLDIYIDDYNTFVPLTQEQIGKMTFSKQLLSRPDLEKLAQDTEKLSELPASGVEGELSAESESVVDNIESIQETRVNPSGENPDVDGSETLDVQRSEADSSSNSEPDK